MPDSPPAMGDGFRRRVEHNGRLIFSGQPLNKAETMENWLNVAVFAGTVCFSIVAFLYLFIYSKYKSQFLLLWSCAWLSHALRNAVILVNELNGTGLAWRLIEQLLVINTGMFLLWGSLNYFGTPAKRGLLPALLLAAVWIPSAFMLHVPQPWFYIPAYFYFSAALLVNGYVVLKKSPPASIGGRIAGLALILWGFHDLDYPFLRPVAWFAPWGFLIGASLGLLSAIAVIMAYFERLQEELVRSENRFRSLFHGHDAPFLLVEPGSGDIVDANEGAAGFYGYARDELRSMNIARISTLSPDELALVPREVIEGRRKKFMLPHRLKSGEERIVEVYAASVEVSGRALLFSIIHDVTERKRAEDALRESEERLRIIADNSHDWEYWRAPDGKYLWVSPSCETISGHRAVEFTGEAAATILKITHPDDRRLWEGHINDVDSLSPGHRELDMRIVKPTGEIVWISHTCKPIFGKDGTFLGRRGCNRDITRRKLAEQALKDSEERLRRAEGVAGTGNWEFDIAGQSVDASDGARRICGLRRKKMTLAEVQALPLPEYRRPLDEMLHGLITENKPYSMDFKLRRPTDAAIVDIHAVAEHDANRNIVFGIIQDISERKKSEESLLRATNQANAANKVKSEFLANMSHEIRTPLNGVMGMLQLLNTTALDAQQKECLLAALQSSQRLSRLLSDILDLSRIDAGRLALQKSAFTVNEVRDSLAELFRVAAQEKGLGLEFFFRERMPPVLIGDENRLLQILFNLVGNAVKFTEQGGVRVEADVLAYTGSARVRILFSVSDTGIGIADDQLQGIFEPFTQAEGSYTRRFQGAGLGLSIVRKLVRLMDGGLAVDSAAGRGTTFYLSLPFTLPGAGPGQAEQPVPPARAATRLRVLFAEDDQVSSISGKRMLEKFGHTVVAVADGRKALARLAEQDFDLLLMDVQMPVLDGVEATRRIRASGKAHAGIPIVAMTAYAMPGDREKFLAAGMDDYLTKPVEIEELDAVIRRVLDKRTAR